MRLAKRIWGALGILGRGLSKTPSRLHLSKVGSPRTRFAVAGIMLCGGVVLLAVGVFGLLRVQRDDAESLPTGDLSAIITPAGRQEPTPTATTTPVGPGEPTPAPTSAPVREGELTPAPTSSAARQGELAPAPAIMPLPDVAAPRRIVIDKIGVDAPIITLGADANLHPEVPDDPYVVAWYEFSTKPGQGSNAVFAGHVDWTVNGQPVTGVFWGLRELEEGDVVKVLLEDGSELRYRVTHSIAIGYDDPEGVKVMYRTPNDVITLISCGGTWVPNPSMALGGNYTHRLVVRAELVT